MKNFDNKLKFIYNKKTYLLGSKKIIQELKLINSYKKYY